MVEMVPESNAWSMHLNTTHTHTHRYIFIGLSSCCTVQNSCNSNKWVSIKSFFLKAKKTHTCMQKINNCVVLPQQQYQNLSVLFYLLKPSGALVDLAVLVVVVIFALVTCRFWRPVDRWSTRTLWRPSWHSSPTAGTGSTAASCAFWDSLSWVFSHWLSRSIVLVIITFSWHNSSYHETENPVLYKTYFI